jgi:hypothetical protein
VKFLQTQIYLILRCVVGWVRRIVVRSPSRSSSWRWRHHYPSKSRQPLNPSTWRHNQKDLSLQECSNWKSFEYWWGFDTSNFIHPQSVLRQVHSLFQNKFSTECDLVLPLPISSTVSFPQSHPATISVQLWSMKHPALTVSLCWSSSCLRVLHLTRPRQLEYVTACCPVHVRLSRKSGSRNWACQICARRIGTEYCTK